MSIFEQKKLGLALIFSLLSGPVLALSCSFTAECMETDGCSDTSFSATLDQDANTLSTDFGDLEIGTLTDVDGTVSVFATGEGANYLLTIVGGDARLATHMTGDAMMISYAGTCEK